MSRRLVVIAALTLTTLVSCGSSGSDDAADTTAALADTTAVSVDDPNDGVISDSEWAEVQPKLEDGGVTQVTHELVSAAIGFACTDVQLTEATTTAEFIDVEAPKVVAQASGLTLDDTSIGAVIGTVATYACADLFSKLTTG